MLLSCASSAAIASASQLIQRKPRANCRSRDSGNCNATPSHAKILLTVAFSIHYSPWVFFGSLAVGPLGFYWTTTTNLASQGFWLLLFAEKPTEQQLQNRRVRGNHSYNGRRGKDSFRRRVRLRDRKAWNNALSAAKSVQKSITDKRRNTWISF